MTEKLNECDLAAFTDLEYSVAEHCVFDNCCLEDAAAGLKITRDEAEEALQEFARRAYSGLYETRSELEAQREVYELARDLLRLMEGQLKPRPDYDKVERGAVVS